MRSESLNYWRRFAIGARNLLQEEKFEIWHGLQIRASETKMGGKPETINPKHFIKLQIQR
jgi:hypothetical protein